MSVEGWVLWTGTIGFDTPVLDRIPVAVAEGYDHLSVSPVDVDRLGDPALLGSRAEAAGLRLVMDPVMNWHPTTKPSKSRFGGYSWEQALEMCEQIGTATMSAVAGGTTAVDEDGLTEGFAAVCDRAAAFGALVHLEFIPMTVVPDLATAWRIVQAADRPNGGLLFDTWHWYRGDPDFALLATIPGDKVLAVQVDDAAAEVQGHLW
ncbi:MAG: sugar phosphate isomerase/epimerase family protein, partial [Acidimicrobiia bacterium]